MLQPTSRTRSILSLCAAGFVIVGFWLFALTLCPAPYLWIFSSGAILGSVLMRIAPGNLRALAFNLTVLSTILFITEAYAWHLDEQARQRWASAEGQQYRGRSDPLLGYALPRGQSWRADKRLGSELIYDVQYSTGADGWRITGQSAEHQQRADRALYFFGGSFAFGEGLDDEDTMAYVAASLLGPTYSVRNLAVHGWGPQQMLAIVEEVLPTLDDATSRIGIYIANTDHVSRVVGSRPWLRDGPRYVLDDRGMPYRDGSFADHGPDLLLSQLRESVAFRRIQDSRLSDGDIDLYAAVVARAAELFERSADRAEFHVILWDEPDGDLSRRIYEAMNAKGLRLQLVSRILPGLSEEHSRAGYFLSEHDAHPSTRAAAAIAEYVATGAVHAGG